MPPDYFKFLIEHTDKKYYMFKELVEQFYYDCKVKNLSSNTLRGYGERLTNFYRFLQKRKILFEKVNRPNIQEYILSLKDKVSDYTINGRIRVLKLFFNFLIRDGLWNNGNPMEKISFIKAEKRIKPILRLEQIEQLLKVPNKRTFTGYRNFCMIHVFWDTLIRLSELVNLRVKDVDLKAGLIKVYGKGRKERIVPIGAKAVKNLHYCWIKYRNQIEGEYFFCQSNGKPLTRRHVEKILSRIGEKVKLKVTPHLIRHSSATWWIKQGAQPMYLQNLMGHVSISVTQKYIDLGSAEDPKNKRFRQKKRHRKGSENQIPFRRSGKAYSYFS